MKVVAANVGVGPALKILHNGGVVAHATETCYGLACDLSNPDAVMKLFKIKQRPLDQPVSALFSSIDQAKEFVEWNDEAQKLADEFLPGPLTIILPMTSKKIFPSPNPIPSPSVGIRISSHPLAMQLMQGFRSPLSTTSANLHGQPNPYSAEDIVKQFEGQEFQPDLILDSGELPPMPPSTVINLTTTGSQIRRQGSITM